MERAVGYLHDARDQDRVLVDQLDDFRLVRFGVFEELLKLLGDFRQGWKDKGATFNMTH